MDSIVFHLRAEPYPVGLVTSITPETAKTLIEGGAVVNVESSTVRCFNDAEYEKAGARIVPAGSWATAPPDHFIIGIKQVEDGTFPITQTHYCASHYFKEQKGWVEGLRRFAEGGGTLLDRGWIKTVAGIDLDTFEPLTGLAGACMALKVWSHQLRNPDGPLIGPLPQYRSAVLLREAQDALKEGKQLAGRLPRVIVLGARGRCGRAATDAFEKIGLPASQVVHWGRAETSRPGPYREILESDILINATFITSPIHPFVDAKSLHQDRQLSVIVDLSCDSNGPYHPLPVYRSGTSLEEPTIAIEVPSGPPLTVFAIGYLPVALAVEASTIASRNNVPLFQRLGDWRRAEVWRLLERLFRQKLETLPAYIPRSRL
ncbi:MAG: hypothetical protein M4579_007030 [Chaenotheca gracillima]|nr:MAG: hypothetical protein M4579_007030 [Chaenotheca gracillima]